MATCEKNPEPQTMDAPTFSPYEKMSTDTNCWPSRQLDAIKKWVALEKIHGANFSFTVHASGSEETTTPAQAARRGGYLKPEENFFRLHKHPALLEEEGKRANRLFAIVRESYYTDASTVTVFGELFGGRYPHPDVPPVPDAVPIQGNIVYCPELRFIVYDVAVTHSGIREYLDYDVCMQLFSAVGYLYAVPILTGTLQDMLSLELGFESKLPAKFGLPPLEGKKNIAEGVVIKPLKNIVLDTTKEPRRVIFKRLEETFWERKSMPITPKRQQQKGPKLRGAHTNPDGIVEPTRKSRQKKKLGKDSDFTSQESNLLFLKYEMSALVCEQRVVKTVSKRGIPESGPEWAGLVDALVEDVLESAESENEELWQTCGRRSRGVEGLMEGMKEECRQAVEEYRLQIAIAETTLS